MTWRLLVGISLLGASLSGCVSSHVHEKTLAALEESQEETRQIAAQSEVSRQQASDEIQALREEQTRLIRELMKAQQGVAQVEADLESTRYSLSIEQAHGEQLEGALASMEKDYNNLEEVAKELRWERDLLKSKTADLAELLQLVQKEVEYRRQIVENAEARITVLEMERSRLSNELLTAQTTATKSEKALEDTREELAGEKRSRLDVETQLTKLQDKSQKLERLDSEVRRERAALESKVERLNRELAEADSRIEHLEREKKRVKVALTKAQQQAKMLKASLRAEQEIWSRLQKVLREPSELGLSTDGETTIKKK